MQGYQSPMQPTMYPPMYHNQMYSNYHQMPNDVGGRQRLAEPEMGSVGVNQELIRSKVRTEFYPFLNEQLKELVQQIEMYIQLLYQVLLLGEGEKIVPSD